MRQRKTPSSFFLLGSLVVVSLVSYQIALSTHCAAGVMPSAEPVASLLPGLRSPLHRQHTHQRLTLEELMSRDVDTSCPSDKFVLMNDTIISPSRIATEEHRRIPRILHVTTKSRCLPQQFADNLQLWKDALPDHSFFLHNDAAMDALIFDQDWPEFPHLTQALQCSLSVAAKADLWRALVLWEFGGIYTDIDNAPRRFNATSIQNSDQAYFVVEQAGYLSQYFMALEPKHPLLFLLIQATLHRLMDLRDVDHHYVPFVTGPGALKEAFLHFRHLQGPNTAAAKSSENSNSNVTAATKLNMLVDAGIYTGLGNATVTVVGRRSQADDIVARNVIYKKRRIYQQLMNMTHFSRIHSSREAKAQLNTDSCFERLWKRRSMPS